MNQLYPVFLKVDQLNVLLVGAGNVGLEKLHFLLKSSPNANVAVVSKTVNKEVKTLAIKHDIRIIQRPFLTTDLKAKHIVISATNNRTLNKEIHHLCRQKNILINVADNPDLCDFFLGGIVTKGNVKIAISTNGKSPSLAKRLRQFFEKEMPIELDELATKLNKVRYQFGSDLKQRTKTINQLTEKLLQQHEYNSN